MAGSREIDLLREVMEEEYEPDPQPEPTVKPEATVEPHHTVEQPGPLGRSRRTLRNIVRTWSPEEILQLIRSRTWPYRTWAPFYHIRDRALMSLLFLTAGRVGEVITLVLSQFDRKADPQFIIIRNMLTEKIGPASSNLPFREEFPLPRSGRLQPFTELVVEYLDKMEEYTLSTDRLFPFNRSRAYQIVNHITGKWPHWFRAQGERYYGKVFKDIFKLRDHVNVVNIRTLAKYIKTEWEESREELLR